MCCHVVHRDCMQNISHRNIMTMKLPHTKSRTIKNCSIHSSGYFLIILRCPQLWDMSPLSSVGSCDVLASTLNSDDSLSSGQNEAKISLRGSQLGHVGVELVQHIIQQLFLIVSGKKHNLQFTRVQPIQHLSFLRSSKASIH